MTIRPTVGEITRILTTSLFGGLASVYNLDDHHRE
jgi:hypothetical protein